MSAKRQRVASAPAPLAEVALRHQLAELEAENAALRSARRLLAAEDASVLQAVNKRLRAERSQLKKDIADMKESVGVAICLIAMERRSPSMILAVCQALAGDLDI